MTAEQYRAKLKIIVEYAPNHALLPTLRKGHSTMNALYIENVLGEVLTADAVPPPTLQPIVERDPSVVKDEILNSMLGKKYSLKSQLRATSNQFHNCKTTSEAKAVSVRVNDLFDEYRALQRDINYYELYGKMPPSVLDENQASFYVMPTEKAEIEKGINTAHVTISSIKKELDGFGSEVLYDTSHPFKGRFRTLEQRLKKWEERRRLLKIEREKLKKAAK
jgi:hypothetical protein